MTLTAFLLVVLSAALHAGWNVIAKRHAGNYSLIYLSFCIGFVLCSPFAWPHIRSGDGWASAWPLVAVTGVLHAVYGLALSLTYRSGDISTLYPIVRGSGIAGAVVVAVLLLGERMPTAAWPGVAAVITGIALLSYRRNRAATSARGILLALFCGSLIMAYTVLDKVIVGRIHPVALMASSQLISAVVFLPYVLLRKREEMAHTITRLWKPTLTVAAMALGSYLIILFAFRIAPLGPIVAVREVSVVFGALAGHWWLKEDLGRLRLAGVGIVAIGIVLVRYS